MPVVKKERKVENDYGKIMVNDIGKDHSTDPFVAKKVEDAKAFLTKNGFPGQEKKNN